MWNEYFDSTKRKEARKESDPCNRKHLNQDERQPAVSLQNLELNARVNMLLFNRLL